MYGRCFTSRFSSELNTTFDMTTSTRQQQQQDDEENDDENDDLGLEEMGFLFEGSRASTLKHFEWHRQF